MNKLTKVGCSALCGSLAAISAANAGDMTVTGGADLTWVSLGGGETGNPIGLGSNFTLKGSGEFDNGWTVDYAIAEGNGSAYSAANVTIGMGSLGKINVNQGNSGNGLAAFDDKMPTAWEESWGAGASTGIRTLVGSGASMNVMYTTPTLLGTTMTFTLAPQYGSADVSDKNTSTNNSQADKSWDATLNINPSFGTEVLSGWNMFAAASEIVHHQSASGFEHNGYEGVAGMTFDIGPLSIGGQASAEYTGEDETAGFNGYKNVAYGVAFNINDDLSVSYGQWEARKAAYTDDSFALGGPNDRNVKARSWQAAYTMGGASIRVAKTKVDNAQWAAGSDLNATTLSLGLAF